jgi:hypothetical protein
MASQKRTKAKKKAGYTTWKELAAKKKRHKWVFPRNSDGSKLCAKCELLATERRRVTSPCKGKK